MVSHGGSVSLDPLRKVVHKCRCHWILSQKGSAGKRQIIFKPCNDALLSVQAEGHRRFQHIPQFTRHTGTHHEFMG
jgi:hypothetical protein